MSPKLSILITYFNEKAKLTRCLKSILAQAPSVFEIVIHDDASRFPAQDYVPDDPRIRIIVAAQNRGPSRARNLLAQEALGDYVHFHDSDDWFEPDWSSLVQAKLCENVDVVYTDVRSVYGDGLLKGQDILSIGELNTASNRVSRAIASSLLIPSSTIRRQFLLDAGGFRDDLHQSEDYEFNIRLLAAKPIITVIERSLVTIEVHDQSRSKDVLRVYTDALAALLEIRKYCPAHDQDISEAAAGFAHVLYRAGFIAEARTGFQLARRLGPSRGKNRSRLFQVLSRWLGQEFAERVSLFRQRHR